MQMSVWGLYMIGLPFLSAYFDIDLSSRFE